MTGSTDTARAVRAAVEALPDPELHRSFGELNMVRSVVAGGHGRIAIELALTTQGCPLRDRIRAEVVAAARTVTGVANVDVDFTTMGQDERARVGRLGVQTHADPTPAREIYAVASGKGGVGKSTIAANLAVALAAAGRTVGLLDADVWGYSVPQLFGVRRAPVVLNGQMLPVEAYGVRLMSLGFFVEENEPVVWRGPMLHKALSQFISDTNWDAPDVLLLDLPPGTGDVTLSVLELLPEAALLAVTTPQLSAQVVASRVGVMAREVHMPVAGVVENMSELVCPACAARTPLFGAGGGQRLADQLGCALLGQVPLDAGLREAGDLGVPVVHGQPRAPSAVALSATAQALRPARRGLAGRPLTLTPVPR